jgi:hypothetical protein
MVVKQVDFENFILGDMLLLERDDAAIIVDGDLKAIRLESDRLEAGFPLCESVVRQLAADRVRVHERKYGHLEAD